MKRSRLIPLVLFWGWVAAWAASCISVGKTEAPTMTMAPSASTGSNQELSDIVHEILTQGGWEGKQVTLVGYYRGWDLLGEIGQAPPVTRSDWVIKDNSGAIYVQANNVEIEGKEQLSSPDELSPHNKEAVNHILRVTGVVRLTSGKQPYIEPTRIQVVK